MEKDQFAELVFDTANGVLEHEACVPGIENLFASGSVCDLLYREMTAARERLSEKTGLEEDDPDIDGIIDPLMRITRMIGVRMFLYGLEYGSEEQNL